MGKTSWLGCGGLKGLFLFYTAWCLPLVMLHFSSMRLWTFVLYIQGIWTSQADPAFNYPFHALGKMVVHCVLDLLWSMGCGCTCIAVKPNVPRFWPSNCKGMPVHFQVGVVYVLEGYFEAVVFPCFCCISFQLIETMFWKVLSKESWWVAAVHPVERWYNTNPACIATEPFSSRKLSSRKKDQNKFILLLPSNVPTCAHSLSSSFHTLCSIRLLSPWPSCVTLKGILASKCKCTSF